MTRIPRHCYPASINVETDINVAAGLKAITGTANRMLERIERSELSREEALDMMLTVAEARCEVDPDAEEFETWEAWVTAMQLGSAQFVMATAPEGSTVTCRIKEKEWHLPATGAQPHVNAHFWIQAFYLAMICRENERLTEMARVPVSLLRDSGATFEEYIYSWVETLQCFWLGQEDVSTHLVVALDGTGPDSARHVDQEQMSMVLYPPIILFYRYLRGDHAQFNEALTDAIRWHKSYWSGDDDRAMSSEGYVALGPLAIACLARDKGFPIEVDSEYLPKALLNHAWGDEIDT
ncbi:MULTISPECIES: immunity 49 family protein [unclassified Streptomyces]|uniref:immunity 49 family protein n=1 Tax=unclassified Streptomyces TaxID=2593676 RepID=UPI0033F6FC25